MRNLSISRLVLDNFRCFERLEIDFHPEMTVLVAANGGGKTSVLDAIAVAFGPYLGAFDEGVGKHFQGSDIRMIRTRDTMSNEMEYAADGVMLEAEGFVPGSSADVVGRIFNELSGEGGDPGLVVWKRCLAGPVKAKTTIKEARELINYGKNQQKTVRTPGFTTLLPLLAYYGTGRLWQHKKLTDGKLPKTSRTIGYTDCFDSSASYKSFLAWFQYWNQNAKSARLAAMEVNQPLVKTEFETWIQSVQIAVDTCLQHTGWKNIEYSFSRRELVAHHDEHGEMPVEWLSDGIRNMIGMVADLAFRATKLNPHLGATASKNTPGIVLIDEVDMHLHPEWQQTVIQSLRDAFPAVQFIVTTHSPQVLSTIRRENIRVLEQDETKSRAQMPDFSPLAHESSDALARVMGTHPIPPLELQDKIREFEQLVRTGLEQTPEAHTLGEELGQSGYEFHESDLTTWRFLAARKSGKQGS